MDSLTEQEDAVLRELARLVGSDRVFFGRELIDQGFTDFVATVYRKNLGYPGSLQSRTLQILRDKGYIKMDRRNGGTYTILNQP